VELRFVPPELARLDEIDSEVLACSVWSDARPSHGLAGLCDWRLGGHLSDLQRRGLVTGILGEVVLLPGKPRLTFDKILVFGAGPRGDFDEETFHAVVRRMLAALEGLSARVSVVELPGRHDGLIAADRAADILLTCAGRTLEHDAWTLVEHNDGRQRIVQHMIEERRRVRRAF
jgi:hypothetical protein